MSIACVKRECVLSGKALEGHLISHLSSSEMARTLEILVLNHGEHGLGTSVCLGLCQVFLCALALSFHLYNYLVR